MSSDLEQKRERFKKARAIFEVALDLASSERDTYIDVRCGDDFELKQQVADLIRAHRQIGHILDDSIGAVLPPSEKDLVAEPLRDGTVVAQRFEISGLLGRGGMGTVYQAWDKTLRRHVALKMLSSRLADDPDGGRRLKQEAAALAALRHPNICTVYDLFESEEGDCIVMEYLEGQTLASSLRNEVTPGAAEAVGIALEVCKALAYAHASGVLHRDVKPANIMLTAEGTKLLDFGIASSVRRAAGKQSNDGVQSTIPETVTLQGHTSIAGTVQYMSPEQALGLQLDGRSDLFSLGIVLFQLMTGMLPFRGESMADVLDSIVRAEAPRLRQIKPEMPVALELIIATCLSKDPKHRYSSAQALERDLRRIIEHPGLEPAIDVKAVDSVSERPARALAAITIVVAAVAIYVYRQHDLRSAIRMEYTKTDAIARSRDIARQLGCPADKLSARAVLSPSFEFDEFLATHGSHALRTVLQAGYSFAWQISFEPANAKPGDLYEGCSVFVDVSGRFLHYGARVPSALDFRKHTFPPGKEAELARAYLRLPPDVAIVSGKPEFWPTGYAGWTERAFVHLSESRILALEQGLHRDGKIRPLKGILGERVPTALAQARGVAEWSVSLFGLGVYFARRRYLSLSWRVPVTLSLSVALTSVWWLSARSQERSVHASEFVATAVVWLISIPTLAGLYAWVRHSSRLRTAGLEHLLQIGKGYWTTATDIKVGILAGVVMASLSLLQFAATQLGRHWPDISSLHGGLAGGSPLHLGEVRLALSAGIAAIFTAAVYELVSNLSRSQKVALIVTTATVGLLYGDMQGTLILPLTFWFARVATGVFVYQRAGVLGLIVAQTVSMLLGVCIVGTHLSNARFLIHSIVLLAGLSVALLATVFLGRRRACEGTLSTA